MPSDIKWSWRVTDVRTVYAVNYGWQTRAGQDVIHEVEVYVSTWQTLLKPFSTEEKVLRYSRIDAAGQH